MSEGECFNCRLSNILEWPKIVELESARTVIGPCTAPTEVIPAIAGTSCSTNLVKWPLAVLPSRLMTVIYQTRIHLPLEDCARQDQCGDREVNHDPGHVHKGRDEGR